MQKPRKFGSLPCPFNDNFRIEPEDDELQRDEMEEKKMEKEREEEEVEVEVEQRKEEGELPFRGSKPPFSYQLGFTCICYLSTMMIQHILSVFVVVSKFHEMNMYVLYLAF
jgi:hypothetical protein